ncbi:MAG: Sporulation initiation phosphotransferase F [Elusimicrobia bacterium]|nr:Sporulation initiation phosphotransferase F [Elusimicrobiota bacterium]
MKRILIVEDHYALRRLFSRFLTREKCQVELAANDQDANEIIQSNEFEIAFIDVELGKGPDGFQLAKRFRLLRPDMRIIMMSARSEYGSRAVSEFDGFMLKPFTLDEISFHVFR